MKRSPAALLAVSAGLLFGFSTSAIGAEAAGPAKAGFAKVSITPPVGTRMYGFASRDRDRGCEGVHDELFVRALYVSHGEEKALVMGFDLLFFGRDDADRFKRAVASRLDISFRQILLNCSHTHCGPMVGTTWAYADYGYGAAEQPYRDVLEKKIVEAAERAKESAVAVTISAGAGKSSLPVSRRKPDGRGGVRWAPYHEGVTCDHLPVVLFQGADGKPVCLLFSVSCHPSTISGFQISADYPGPAMDRLDGHLGAECSLFLQGAGGDTKASVIGQGEQWSSGPWEKVAEAGRIVADEVIQVVDAGLQPVKPAIHSALVETQWPLQAAPGRAELAAIVADEKRNEIKRLWARRQIKRLDRGRELHTRMPVLLQGLQLGHGCRLIALEGEAVAGLGLHILKHYKGQGVTFPLGYSNGMQGYLPTSAMIDEGGYEVLSYHEYGQPAPPAKGMETIITNGLEQMRKSGVE